MTEDEKKLLEEEFRKAGSVPALLEAMAQGEKQEFRERRHQVEQGRDHPTGDELYNYVLGWLDRNESLLIMDHLVLCGTCLREVIKIRQIEEALTEDALERADNIPLITRIKDFVSSVSFPVSMRLHALETVRGTKLEAEQHSYTPGTKLTIALETPADGYVTIFHGCEETGKVKLVFPWEPEDNPRVIEGQRVEPIPGYVEGPPGRHFLKTFWTKDLLLSPREFDLKDEEERENAIGRFLEAIENIPQKDWKASISWYEVSGE